MITLGVREFDGSPDGRRRFCGNKYEKSRSLPQKLIRTRQEDCHEVQELVVSPPEHCREIVGSSLEDRRRKPRLTNFG